MFPFNKISPASSDYPPLSFFSILLTENLLFSPQNVYFFLFFFSYSLLFLDLEPLEMPRIPPTLSVVTPAESLPQKNQNLFFTLSHKCLLYQFPLSASAPPHFSSPSALESPTISLGTPSYSTPPSITRWAAAPHKSTIVCLSRIYMDSGWVEINPKTSRSD